MTGVAEVGNIIYKMLHLINHKFPLPLPILLANTSQSSSPCALMTHMKTEQTDRTKNEESTLSTFPTFQHKKRNFGN